MHHLFYSYGDAEQISWTIKTDNTTINEKRNHVDIYKNKVNKIQSKYIALHVGLFWGIGVFVIKNNDIVKIKIDEKEMLEQLTTNSEIDDEFIKKRIQFIHQLINQRKLKVEFEMIQTEDNLAKQLVQRA